MAAEHTRAAALCDALDASAGSLLCISAQRESGESERERGEDAAKQPLDDDKHKVRSLSVLLLSLLSPSLDIVSAVLM